MQQYLTRGSPRHLAERDRATLARYFGVPETVLGAPPPPECPAMRTIPRLDVAASAGPGAAAVDGRAIAGFTVDEAWLARLRPRGGAGGLSMIAVVGDSMEPTLSSGDELIVDTGDTRLRDGLFVIRLGDALHVKRLVCEGASVAIRSDNPAAAAVTFDAAEPPAIVGRVLWVGRVL